ncbi:MAG: outer membrane protein assembly factor BamD [Bryobacteraceae bacterium]|nr:outer membrane protein assembly factor BamD [Bryobacteraceae bacterium]
MHRNANWGARLLVLVLVVGLLGSCGFRRKKYENPITKDTQQPDKVLFDKAVRDIERGRFEVARLTLQTLINTYDTSEYLAKAKLAIADSWYREGGSHALAQAEAEYKDFILFYPTMEESAEAQARICMIHYKGMEKPDRDDQHAIRADEECRQLLAQFPNSKFVPQVQQLVRNIQEVLAEREFRVGTYYHTKGSYFAAANRLQTLTDHYPLFSKSDDALWKLGDAYGRMGPKFRQRSGDAFAKIVKDYPLSDLADEAKKRLTSLEMPIPEADPVAIARMKYEQEHFDKPGFFNPLWSVLRKGPDTYMAARSGTPAQTTLRPSIPASVPVPGAGAGSGFTGDVTVSTVNDGSNLDTKPDARLSQQGGQGQGQADPAAGAQPQTTQPQPAAPAKENKKNNRKKDNKKEGDKSAAK